MTDPADGPPIQPSNVVPMRHYGATYGRTPPHNDSDERVVLSAALTDEPLRTLIVGQLGSHHRVFYADSHQRLYQAIADLVLHDQPADFMSVLEWLRTHDILTKIGDESRRGLAFLNSFLSEPSLSTPAIAAACDRIQHSAILRQIAEEASLIAAAAYRHDADLTILRERISRLAPAPDTIETSHGFALQDATAIFTPLEVVEYTIDQVARKGSLILLGAYGGSFKTWLALEAILSIGAGVPWLGRFTTTPGPATMIDCESGSYELRRRLQLLARARDIGGNDPPQISICSTPGIYMTDEDFKARMLALARDHAFITIDSLAAMSPGVDENTTGMRRGLDILREVAELTHCTFMVLCHAKKLGNQQDEIDEREILRGSSAIYDAADGVFAVQRIGHDPNVRTVVKQTKVRHGRKVDPFDLVIADYSGGVLLTAADLPNSSAPLSRKDMRARFRSAVVAIVRQSPSCSKRSILAALQDQALIGRAGFSRDAARDEIDLLVEDGVLTVTATPKGGPGGGGHLYSVLRTSAVDEAASVRADSLDGQ